MITDLNAEFAELKAKSGIIDGASFKISEMEIGEVIQIDLVGINSSGVKKAIEMATKSNRMVFDHVIDKDKNRALVKRMDDVDASVIMNADECVKRKIIQIVSASGSLFESSVKQRTLRSKEWSSFVDVGGDPLSFASVLSAVIATGAILKSGARITINR